MIKAEKGFKEILKMENTMSNSSETHERLAFGY